MCKLPDILTCIQRQSAENKKCDKTGLRDANVERHRSQRMASAKRPSSARIIPYWNFRAEITFVEEMLFKRQKVIVPKSLRKEMLAFSHESHLGINKCKSRARDSFFFG